MIIFVISEIYESMSPNLALEMKLSFLFYPIFVKLERSVIIGGQWETKID